MEFPPPSSLSVAECTHSVLSAKLPEIQQNECAAFLTCEEAAQTDQVVCQCLQCLLVLFEDMQIQKHQAKTLSVDFSLCFQKRAMDCFDAMLECKHFGVSSYSIILLIDICEKLFTSVHHGWRGSVSHKSNLPGEEAEMNSVRILVGNYELNSSEEQAHVVRALRYLSLKRLNKLLARFEAIAMAERWQTQLNMMRSLMAQTQDACRKDDRDCDDW